MTIKMTAMATAIAALAAGAASADSFTFRIGSGHPNGPAVYVADTANFFVPEVKKRAAAAGHTVEFVEGDFNGDGKDDVCGRDGEGILCALASQAGTGFNEPKLWTSQFNNDQGWSNEEFAGLTIRFPDLNGDGIVDSFEFIDTDQDGVIDMHDLEPVHRARIADAI